jgi:hypothetical protein
MIFSDRKTGIQNLLILSQDKMIQPDTVFTSDKEETSGKKSDGKIEKCLDFRLSTHKNMMMIIIIIIIIIMGRRRRR